MMENRQMAEVNILIQDHTGDRKLSLSWDTGDSEAAKQAQQRMEDMFKDLQKSGYRFFSTKKVLGLFKKKGKEVKTYDPKLGELIYEEGPKGHQKEQPIKEEIESSEVKTKENPVQLKEVETKEKVKLEEPKKFDPSKENVDTSRDYVATKPMRAG